MKNNTTDKLFCVCFSGNYSISYGWDTGWCNSIVYPAFIIDDEAVFHVGDRSYGCRIDSEFVDRWGGYVDNIREYAGSRSADVYVWADDKANARAKAHDVIMRFCPPSADYFKEATARAVKSNE